MNKQKIFISHYSEDKEIADSIKEFFERVSLNQLDLWHSSDISEQGGIKAGTLWFDEIQRKLQESKIVIALLTSNSIDRPWIYFECGIAEALEDCLVIPLIAGMNKTSDIPAPLSLYQSYELSDYSSLKRFTLKLFEIYSLPFDEEILKDFTQKTSEKIKSQLKERKTQSSGTADNYEIDHLKIFIDNKFQELNKRLVNQYFGTKGNLKDDLQEFQNTEIITNFNGDKESFFLEIDNKDTVGSVLNRIFFNIREHVNSFTYLTDWVLQDPQSKKNLVVYEIQDLVPASLFFRDSSKWQVRLLKAPYKSDEFNKKEYNDFFDN